MGSTGPCVRQAPCSWQPDSAERNTEWYRCYRCSWCRRWLSRTLPLAARLHRWLCSTPAGCCSLAARGSVSRLWLHTDISRVINEHSQRLRRDVCSVVFFFLTLKKGLGSVRTWQCSAIFEEPFLKNKTSFVCELNCTEKPASP